MQIKFDNKKYDKSNNVGALKENKFTTIKNIKSTLIYLLLLTMTSI